MRSDSFDRGGQPRSVPDHDHEGYERMIKAHKAMSEARESGASSQGRSSPAPHDAVDQLVAGIVHILNEPRAARREVERGHPIKGAINGVAAAADIELGRSVAGGIDQGALKASGSHAWKATRKWMAKTGRAAKGQHVHHALIPNGGWGKLVPDVIKNQPWNLKAMESPLHHIRIHGRSLRFDLPRFSAIERYWHGTPTWWKAANASVAAHVAEPATHALSDANDFIGRHLHPRQSTSPAAQRPAPSRR
jgi:hypothetical protein